MSLPDSSSCHHCHIHAPIPARDLKRTHPLRSHVDKPQDVPVPRNNEQTNNTFRKNVSFLYRKINRKGIKRFTKESQTNVSIPIPQPPLPPRVDSRPSVVADSLPLPETPSRRPRPLEGRVRRRRRGLAGLQAVLLVGAYALLLVLAVVIGVVLTQNPRRFRPQASNAPLPPPRPVFRDAAPAPAFRDAGPGPVFREVAPAQPVRVSRPRFPSGPHKAVRLPPTTPEPEVFEYEYVDDTAQDLTLLPNPVSAHFPSPPPTQPAFRPLPAPAPRPQVSQPQHPQEQRRPSTSPRRTTVPLASLDRDFSLNQEQSPRGRKEPEVKILRSWSHQNADGTFSWGYINDDGSFKNETRGLDCVVRGVYGYIDKVTGDHLTFPYESGNPCDPDAPDDYFYDYDTNPIQQRPPTAPRPASPPPSSQPRRLG